MSPGSATEGPGPPSSIGGGSSSIPMEDEPFDRVRARSAGDEIVASRKRLGVNGACVPEGRLVIGRLVGGEEEGLLTGLDIVTEP
jgi:hypothetical protein